MEGQPTGGAAGVADAAAEWLDVLDAEGATVGRAQRAVVHQQGWWHRTVHVWVLRPGAREPHAVFQWRTADRRQFPNLLDVTCGGHVGAGEPVEEAMRRELAEELGLGRRARVESLGPVAVEAQDGGPPVREWAHEFVHVSRRPPAAYRVAAEEVQGLLAAPLGPLEALWRGEQAEARVAGVRFDRGRPVPMQRLVRRADFVPAPASHYAAWAHRMRQAYARWQERPR